MTVGRTWAVALLGLDGSLVEVEAGLGTQTPGVRLIGLPDSALREAEHRVRAGILNSGLEFPARHVTVNLSPAELPKQGAGFDLAIAMATLVAEGSVPPESVARAAHLGELALDGRLRPLRGVLPAVLAAARAGVEVILVPSANADEASLVPGIRVVAVPDLREAAIWHGASLESLPTEPITAGSRVASAPIELDLADVIGNEEAIDALIVAAAGGHHVYMVGPPGAGKTMLAARLPSILPPLDEQAALEVASLRSLAGVDVGDTLSSVPPFESPHHTATASAMIGGGSRVIRPGSAARASNGILFLDEAPEFGAKVLDTLRQPLESGRISVERATAVAHFPARFQLVLAANPCPCGHYGSRDALCSCPPMTRDRYLKRISGPLLDRVDIRLSVPRVTAAQLRMQARQPHTTSAQARERVLAARARASRRLADTPWRSSGEVPGHFLRSPEMRLDPKITEPLDRALERGSISMRGYDRTLRVKWTVLEQTFYARSEGYPRDMTQGEVGHLIAQLCITILILAASGIPLIAGLSALEKWKTAVKAQGDYDEQELQLREMATRHDRERIALVTDGTDLAALEALNDGHQRERYDAGFRKVTFLDDDVTTTLGERPAIGFQAPKEVAWAIIALICAAAAGVWDLWLS